MEYIKSKDGTKIAYEKIGSGPALILVGGGLCERHSASCGAPLAKLLAKDFTVYSFDRRGRGDSGDVQPYSVQREIEDIAALIANAGGSAALYGMSSGAILSLKATASGLPVSKLIMFEPPFSTDKKDAGLWRKYTAALNEHLDAGRNSDAVKLFMNTVGMPKLLIKIISHSPFWPKAKALAPSLRYDAQVMHDRMLPTGKLLVQTPTLVLDGSKSPASMLAATSALARLLPNAQRQTLPRQTHNASPKALAPAISAFLKSA